MLTDVEVWLPAGTFLYDVLYYTTADGEEVRREVYLDKNGSMITLDGGNSRGQHPAGRSLGAPRLTHNANRGL